MNNYHFNASSNRSVQLKKELELMNQDIEESKKQLYKKNLQLQFYQDPDYVNNKPSLSQKHIKHSQNNNYIPKNPINDPNQNNTNKNVYENLADQIMNDLLQDNNSKPIKYQQNNLSQHQNYDPYQNPTNKLYQNNPANKLYQNQNNFNPFIQNSQQNQNKELILQNNPQQPFFLPRQNNFIPQNKRQLEKQKLQNPSSYQQNPFIPKAQPVKRSIETKQQKPIVNERELQKLKLQQQSTLNQNPFWGQNNKNRSQQKPNQNKDLINYQQYQNIRQKQKQKLQKQLLQNQNYDFFQRPTSPNQIPAQKDIQSQNISKKAAFQNRYSNPFVKNQDHLRQIKQQQQREYRRALEQQKKIQEQRKKNERQKVKEQKYAFNSYDPGTVVNAGSSKNVVQQNDIPIKSPALSKKVDPNGKPPVYTYEQGSKSGLTVSEREYMNMKANELKENFKRGRILHDQYLSQVKKLAQYYKVDYRELVDRKDLDEKEQDLPWIKDKKQLEPIKIQQDKKITQEVTQRKQNQSQNYQITENLQSLQKFPDSESSLKNNQFSRQPSSPSRNPSYDPYSGNFSHQPYIGNQYPSNPISGLYTQNLSGNPQQHGLASTSFIQQMQGVDYDLMRRMFEEMKAMRSDYTKSLQKQKAFLQQTFMKILANGVIQNQNQLQNQSQSRNQRITDLSPKQSKKNQNVLTQNSQQSYNQQSLQFIEKSLSGIVNKIPFYRNSINRSNDNNKDPSFMMGTPQQNINRKETNKKDKNNNQNRQSIEQFFSKPYKCKKFKKFSIMVDVSQSSMQIPNVSNFLALKNGKDVLNKLFEEDLLMMKKLQRQKDVDKLRNRVDNQLSYGNQTSSYQSSSIQQQNYASQQVSYGQPPSYANYGQTFNRSQNTGQFMIKTEQRKNVVSQSINFEQYENYSRNKQREVRSAHQINHRSYKKVDQSVPETFLKRHVSGQQQNLPDFADQSDIKGRSPVYYSPKLGSQILEQDEYQTAQKSTSKQLLESEFYGSSVVKKAVSPEEKQSTNKKYKMKKKDYAYEQERQSQKKSKSKEKSLSFKEALKQESLQKEKQQTLGMMKMIKKNNKILKKYQISPQNRNDYTPKQEQVDIGEYSSINTNLPKEDELKNYFSGVNDKNNSQQNDSYKLPPLVANLKNVSGNQSDPLIEKKLSNKFNTQKQEISIYDRQQSIEEIKSDNDDLQEDHSEYVSSRQYPTSRNQNIAPYEASQQQTVKSINYSVASSRRPPQSIHISQTVESIQESASRLKRPPLNKKKSTSKKKQSSIIRTKFQKDSILQKPPPSESQMNSMIHSDDDNDLVIDKQPLKFDSNVYDSEYEQSVSQKDLQKRISQLQNQGKKRISEPQINISPPTIGNGKSSVLNIQGIESKSLLMGGSKLKSLQEARNLAKQSKKKSTNLNENDQIFKYEQKMSELESFLTKRQESTIKQTKETKTIKLAIQKSPPQKKNIMNLLDELQNESSYKDDFQSYRQQSQRPKY